MIASAEASFLCVLPVSRFGLQLHKPNSRTAAPGGLTIRNALAPIRIAKRVGSIVVNGSGGDVEVASPHTGRLEITNVEGNVTIRGAHEGDIVVRQVSGDLFVEEVRSGNLTIEDVRGRVHRP
jgi:hypothetical protein